MHEDRPHDPDADHGAEQLRARVAATVRELRTRSGRSLADVSGAAGIGKSTLHAIEAGDANPGIETLWALARALGVPFGALLEPQLPAVRVLRAADAPRLRSERSNLEARVLLSTSQLARVELSVLELDPAGPGDPDGNADPHTAGTVEHVLVTSGRLRVGPVDALVDLEVGDLATFPGDVAHRYEARSAGTRAVLLVEYT
ncbi:helix-turn-helix domain-containing protein [Egicoccus halophilus]|uniref:XRE family transcriptional regulator n=1 Tax=Egicoccus halophilus TaxID=1670830 RepID=A0A8J3A8M9_9ACTN|nr:helix-turn-helix domain-containing protein [Egicoccus halophilus]GGI04789.1 XRE family transcriptional regulator [Egicoccus halophilus]